VLVGVWQQSVVVVQGPPGALQTGQKAGGEHTEPPPCVAAQQPLSQSASLVQESAQAPPLPKSTQNPVPER
jgi:hypothetical protein